jgi:Raf kinase inhibitor-like YbhB/YbcL family protein
MKLKSPIFEQGELLPAANPQHGGESPPLAWEDVPEGTASFVLLCDDPDADGGTATLWMLYNLPADLRSLVAGIADDFAPLKGAAHGINTRGNCRYDAPQPSCHPRRVYYRLYALDSRLSLKAGIARGQLVRAMEGHIISEACLTTVVGSAHTA